jgi:phenylalanyl-tRNA synthetase alpha chain
MSSDTALPLDTFVKELESLATDADNAFQAASDEEQLEGARVEFLGARQGRLKSVQKLLGRIARDDKPAGGKKLNEVKNRIQSAHEEARSRLAGAVRPRVRDPRFDPSLPGISPRIGRLHPVTQTIEELKDIMGRLGFTPAEGPEVEDPWHNFEALNIPEIHPARDPLDNFYLAVAGSQAGAHDSGLLLRSQTSTVQIRVMENTPPPVRIISLGRVYRPDTADATHYPMFHQMEGLLVDRHVSLADLKTVLHLFATDYLGTDVPVRIRPSFFPFTEPSVEADYYWNGKWVEFGGAGMVDPHVLTSVGYDPEEVSGFAFGLGIERLCMVRHKITDIRDLFTNDVRFLRQF